MKRIRWSKLSDTEMETDANRVAIKGDSNKELEVKVVDEKGDKVLRYMDVKLSEHRVLLVPKFQWKVSDFEDVSSDNIEYIIRRDDDCWKIDPEERKIIVKPGKQAQFERALKEIHKYLLKDKFNDKINANTRQDVESADMKYTILDDGREGYRVKIYRGDTSVDCEFPWEQVEIKPCFWQNKGVEFDSLINVEYQREEKKSPLTTGWIIFFVVLTAVLILIAVYWKKIWRWIKGEREQEKKVKEQLDIF